MNYYEIFNKLFTFTDWEDVDTGLLYFTNCKLVKNLKDIPEGTKFDFISVNLNKSILEVGNLGDDKSLVRFNIELSVNIL